MEKNDKALSSAVTETLKEIKSASVAVFVGAPPQEAFQEKIGESPENAIHEFHELTKKIQRRILLFWC